METKKENLRCTIRVSACTGGNDPETPGYWDTHDHKISIDILDQGSKEENEKSVLEKLYEGEFTIELDENQDDIESLKRLFNKNNVIKAVENEKDLSNFLDNLQSSVYTKCWDIYVRTYGVASDDDDDSYGDYPNNINEEAFDEIMNDLGSDIVFEVKESRIPEASQLGVSMVAKFGSLRDAASNEGKD